MLENNKIVMSMCVVMLLGAILSGSLSAEEMTLGNFERIERLPAPVSSSNNACGPEVREQVAEALLEMANASESERLALESQLYGQYKYCAENVAQESQSAGLADILLVYPTSCSKIVSSNQFILNYFGSVFYEEMCNCGYDPQRRQFACPVTIKQRFGFGGAPLPGSREYILHCVADPNTGTLVPVGDDSVHLANEIFGNLPPWQFAVIANANQNLSTIYPMNGATRRARSILSWNFKPTSCNYRPIWGNVLNYRIRLDQ